MHRLMAGFALLMLLPALTGACGVIRINKSVAASRQAAILAGEVTCPDSGAADIIAVLYVHAGEHIRPVQYVRLHRPGPYEMMAPGGEYRLFAFEDENGDTSYNEGERGVHFQGGEPLVLPDEGFVLGLDLSITGEATDMRPFVVDPEVSTGLKPKKPSIVAGAPADLDDPWFSADFGRKGYWDPFAFYSAVGGNIHFLEPYDPDRIPVLFVHGAAGSPQDFRYFMENLDRRRYQAWFYYYPSGSSIKPMANLLGKKIMDIHARYNLSRLYVTAHSMGGLVARSFITGQPGAPPFIRLFVTLSTPWGGEPLAESAVERSPFVIPCWKDVRPGSEFLETLYMRLLPDHVAHYLFFGFRGETSPLRPANDGAVTLESQLDARAQEAAVRTFGYNEDHESILGNPQVFAEYSEVLDVVTGQLNESGKTVAANIMVRLHRRKSARPGPTFADKWALWRKGPGQTGPGRRGELGTPLLLLPEDDPERETMVYLGKTEKHHMVGPVVPGAYMVCPAPLGFRSEPTCAGTIAESGNAPAVEFTLTPEGVLLGQVSADGKTGRDLALSRVTVTGNGVRRTVEATPARDFFRRYVEYRDFVQHTTFCLFDLPEGTYDLVLKADGYEPLRITRTVIPGRLGDGRALVMEPVAAKEGEF
ncbi:MAG: esterase/lipase family protein [Desulfatibacillaceae bacterium]